MMNRLCWTAPNWVQCYSRDQKFDRMGNICDDAPLFLGSRLAANRNTAPKKLTEEIPNGSAFMIPVLVSALGDVSAPLPQSRKSRVKFPKIFRSTEFSDTNHTNDHESDEAC